MIFVATGRIHSIESMGLVDGPGIRAVVFFQGCSSERKHCRRFSALHKEAQPLSHMDSS